MSSTARQTAVLVTDGEQRSSLAAVRALGRAGYRVVVAETRLPCLAARSRFCDDAFVYPSPYRSEAGFIAAIRTFLARDAVDLVMPMTDITSAVLAESRSSLPPATTLAMPDAATYWQASDKIALNRLACEMGVPTPTTQVVTPPVDSLNLADVRFPSIVKPARSRQATPRGWIRTSVRRVESSAELQRLLSESPDLQYPFMLQRPVEGEGIGVFALCDAGEPLTMFAHRRIREKPPWGGVSVLRESTAADPVAADYAGRLLRALKWTGVAMVEFKRERSTGVPQLMEINGRFWGSLQLALDAGVDFPVALASLCLGRPVPEQGPYRTGIRSRWLLGDLDHLMMRLRYPRRTPTGSPSLPALLFDFCRFFRRDTIYEVESLDDPRPSLYEFRRYLQNILGIGGEE